MSNKVVHKYKRRYNPFRQFYACSGKKANGAENVAWTWNKVSCSRCRKLKPEG